MASPLEDHHLRKPPRKKQRAAAAAKAVLALALMVAGGAMSLSISQSAWAKGGEDTAEDKAADQAQREVDKAAEKADRAAEKAAERSDIAAEKAAEDAAEQAERAAEKAAIAAEDAADRADRAAADAAERADKAAADAAEKADKAAEDAAEQAAKAAEDAAKAAADAAEDAAKAAADAAEDQAKEAADRAEDAAKQEDYASSGSNSGSGSGSGSGDSGGNSPGSPVGAASPAVAEGRIETFVGQDGAVSVRGEILALMDPDGAHAAATAGYRVLEATPLPELGASLVRVSVPEASTPEEAMRAFQTAVPARAIDYNHIYMFQAAAIETAPWGVSVHPKETYPSSLGIGQGPPVRVGLMEAGLDKGHPCLKGVEVSERDFGLRSRGSPEHGTAVASLLVGCGEAKSAAPIALRNAAVFFNDGSAAAATASNLIKGIDWLASERVSVINMSLSGPHNALLQHALAGAHAKGIAIVAAVGNDGPASPPRYPAAYPEVVAVTAVDTMGVVYRRAVQGAHVAFAAPGVDVEVAVPGGAFGRMTGTSVAAPLAARVIALYRAESADAASDTNLGELAKLALDLGQPGRDPVYGYGLIRPPPGASHVRDGAGLTRIMQR